MVVHTIAPGNLGLQDKYRIGTIQQYSEMVNWKNTDCKFYSQNLMHRYQGPNTCTKFMSKPTENTLQSPLQF